MPKNTTPVFPLNQNVSWGGPITAANTAKDGTGTVTTVFTAGANGSKIDAIHVRALGTNVATVMRFFINNGSTNATAANNTLAHEKTIPATTLSEVAELADTDVTISVNTTETVCPILYLPPGYKINVTIGTAVAAGLQVTVFGADY